MASSSTTNALYEKYESASPSSASPPPRSLPPTTTLSSTSGQTAVVLAIAVSWVTATHLASAAQQHRGDGGGTSSFTLLFVSTSLLSVFLLHPGVRNSQPSRFTSAPMSSFACCSSVSSSSQHFLRFRCWTRAKLSVVAFFLFLWMSCNLSYIVALTLAPVSTVTAIFATAPAFVYIFSLLILKETHDAMRLVAVGAAIVGVTLAAVGATEGERPKNGGSRAWLGCLLSLSAAVLAALYKVSFFKFFGWSRAASPSDIDANNSGDDNEEEEEETREDTNERRSSANDGTPPLAVAHVLGCLGLLCFVVGSPVELFLVVSGFQTLPSSSSALVLLLLYAASSIAFNFAVNFGVTATYPLFVSIGTIVGIPVSVAADCLLLYGPESNTCSSIAAAIPMCGYVAIMLSFSVLLWRNKRDRQPKNDYRNISGEVRLAPDLA